MPTARSDERQTSQPKPGCRALRYMATMVSMDTDQPTETHQYLSGTICRYCGHDRIRVEWRFMAAPWGTYSLAGVQTKIAATQVPFAVCEGCGHESQGKRD